MNWADCDVKTKKKPLPHLHASMHHNQRKAETRNNSHFFFCSSQEYQSVHKCGRWGASGCITVASHHVYAVHRLDRKVPLVEICVFWGHTCTTMYNGWYRLIQKVAFR